MGEHESAEVVRRGGVAPGVGCHAGGHDVKPGGRPANRSADRESVGMGQRVGNNQGGRRTIPKNLAELRLGAGPRALACPKRSGRGADAVAGDSVDFGNAGIACRDRWRGNAERPASDAIDGPPAGKWVSNNGPADGRGGTSAHIL